jgi:hypothetical protein
MQPLAKKIFNSSIFTEKSHCYDPKLISLKGNVFLKGYWQSYRYFQAYQNQIKKDFEFLNLPNKTNQALLKKIHTTESVAVHVRRGDYANHSATNAYHGLTPKSYYQQAYKLIAKKITHPTFYFFSDDPEWVRNHLQIKAKAYYIGHNQECPHEDLRLMSACKHQIIANSSFSWWGAWLNQNPRKIVINPKKWNNVIRSTADLIPKSWIKL